MTDKHITVLSDDGLPGPLAIRAAQSLADTPKAAQMFARTIHRDIAPDAILEALEQLMRRLDSHFGTASYDWKEQEDARAVIAKARQRAALSFD